MNRIFQLVIGALIVSSTIVSCVPQRKFMDVSEKQRICEEENKALKNEAQLLRTKVGENESKIAVNDRKIDALVSDTSVLGTSLRILRSQYDKINALNDELLKKSSSIRQGTEEEKQTLMGELEQVRIALQEKENALNELQTALDLKEEELIEREQNLAEMRSLIARKDSVMNALRKSVSDALLGFEGKGLTVDMRNGQVYVSMDAKLLFATGSTEVDKKGQEAIINLARAVQDRNDLRIMVEGHTDTDSFSRTTYPRNNWDLSVLRATSVVNIMIDNSKIDPTTLTAAGRSEYQPVDPADKAKNRRIEVILSPQLDELMNIINESSE